MTTSLPACVCECFEAVAPSGEAVAFIAVAADKYGRDRFNRYVVSRLVVLPDFQGIGLGTRLLEFVAKRYKEQRKLLYIVTSAKNLISALQKRSWCKLIRYSVIKRGLVSRIRDKQTHLARRKVSTASFFLGI